MPQRWYPWRSMPCLLVVLVFCCGVSSLLAAVLHPYIPPTSQSPSNEPSMSIQQAPEVRSDFAAQNAFLSEFKNRLSQLSTDDRQKLGESLQQSLNEALQRKDLANISYYSKLLEILRSP